MNNLTVQQDFLQCVPQDTGLGGNGIVDGLMPSEAVSFDCLRSARNWS